MDTYAVTVPVENAGGVASRAFTLRLFRLATDGSESAPAQIGEIGIEAARPDWSNEYVFEVDANQSSLPQVLEVRIETDYPEELASGQALALPLRIGNANPARHVGKPQALTLERREAGILVSWEPEIGHREAFLERRTDGGFFTPLARIGADRASFLDTTVESGRRYDYRLRAFGSHDLSPLSDAVGAWVAFDEGLEVVLPDRWVERHFPDRSAEAPGDPDGDGLPNWIEYALGTDPTRSDAGEALRIGTILQHGEAYPVIWHRRLRSPGALRYVLEYSIDLRNWFPAEDLGFARSVTVPESGGSAYEEWTATGPEPLRILGRAFFRIRLTE